MGVYFPDPPDLVGRVRRLRAELAEALEEEAGAVATYGEETSPRRTGNFAESWRNESIPGGAAVVNNATDRRGRLYAPFVHPRGDRTTTNEDVQGHARDRAADLRERLARRGAEILTGG